ncbi:hypothetical protein HX857_09810 [Pseudomonas gingeri]|uniref:hypothetical protein n=1 Tax=Pseudomonas gingeri TaxID=117681 RepID=UPI0015B94509|nr:hypothetical protein [Pseudomonas gingeri]NWE69001.1 hypothetical protein [Pseudomonas gingeri]
MSRKQTIDGVPGLRDLLQKIADGGYCHQGLMDRLRALLDAPAAEERGSSHGLEQSPNTCRHDERSGVWWREGSITRTGRECCACGHVEEDPVEPDAQPQGEPAAYQFQDRDGKWCGFMNEQHYQSTVADGTWPIRALYAEQPAPVAVLPERLQQVLKFLDGAENLDGHWFGEPGPTGSRVWWRAELRKAIAETNLFAKQL